LLRFDGHEVGRLETEMWRSYYGHQPVRLYLQMAELLRRQYHLPFWRACIGAYRASRSAVVFQRGHNRAEYEMALPDLVDYYAIIRRSSDVGFPVRTAARLELEWWIVHRERASHASGDLEQSLAARKPPFTSARRISSAPRQGSRAGNVAARCRGGERRRNRPSVQPDRISSGRFLGLTPAGRRESEPRAPTVGEVVRGSMTTEFQDERGHAFVIGGSFGELIDKTGKRRPHVVGVERIANWLGLALGQDRVNSQAAIDVSPADNPINEPEPDVIVFQRAGGAYSYSVPQPADLALVVEVSDSTLRFDLTVKAALYARAPGF
jgi:hypothetical protein